MSCPVDVAVNLNQTDAKYGPGNEPCDPSQLVGSEAAVVDILAALRPNCRQPVETCEAGSFLALPPPSQPGTLILRDVGNLTQDGQRRLSEWLDENMRDGIQVIATNAAALWPRVRDGSFTETLYYRLNVIYIDLTDRAAPDGELVTTAPR